MIDLVVPKLGLTVIEVEVVRWLVEQGASVRAGDPVIDLNADKTDVVVEALATGVLTERFVHEGDVVAVGGLLGRIDSTDAAIDRHLDPDDERHLEDANEPEIDQRRPKPSSPAARRLAAEHGVPLDSITGTGPGGRVVERDVPVSRSRPALERGLPTLVAAESADTHRLTIEVDPAMMDQGVSRGRSLGLPLRHVHLIAGALSDLARSGRVEGVGTVGWRALTDPPGEVRVVNPAATPYEIITTAPSRSFVDAVVVDMSDTSVRGLAPSGTHDNAVSVTVSACRDEVVAVAGAIAVRSRLTLALGWTSPQVTFEDAVSVLGTLAEAVEEESHS